MGCIASRANAHTHTDLADEIGVSPWRFLACWRQPAGLSAIVEAIAGKLLNFAKTCARSGSSVVLFVEAQESDGLGGFVVKP